ncbi:HAD family hydrolase [Gaoshiqia sediminis]|uniref:HAD family phosphatase n=1 Tax=Gaoshiqia sediminis TaxID=2986998 RepID=A0AA41Y3W5_9BACT|nr:HAD family phosphatase [Gaoshiqia sediminis]MCW0482969.1 HAD family phosphatase [Gaoshiqia sediminis]
MNRKALIFDFNGTLLWDTPLHNNAWDLFLQNHQISLTDLEKNEKIHGKNNRDIFPAIFNKELDEATIKQFVNEKENLYRQLVIESQLQLALGATLLFEQLAERQIPFTIATASGIDNLRFYIERYQLDQWFDIEKIVYDDGTLAGKPAPDYFLKAMQKLNVKAADSIIFEDSFAGIKAAENARAGQIIIVNSTGADYSNYPHPCMTDFCQFDPVRLC